MTEMQYLSTIGNSVEASTHSMDGSRLADQYPTIDANETGWSADDEMGSEASTDTTLHQLLRKRPPMNLVDQVICHLAAPASEQETPEEWTDPSGRTPLHVATAAGCSVQVIKRLLHGPTGFGPAMIKDRYMRYPLHYACSNPRGVNMTSRKARRKAIWTAEEAENMIQVTFYILAAAPSLAVAIDKSGRSPLDLATEHDADESVIRGLVIAAQQFGSLNQIMAEPPQTTKEMDCAEETDTTDEMEEYLPAIMEDAEGLFDRLSPDHPDVDGIVSNEDSEEVVPVPLCGEQYTHLDDVSTIGWEGATLFPDSIPLTVIIQHEEPTQAVQSHSLGSGEIPISSVKSLGRGHFRPKSPKKKKRSKSSEVTETSPTSVAVAGSFWFV